MALGVDEKEKTVFDTVATRDWRCAVSGKAGCD